MTFEDWVKACDLQEHFLNMLHVEEYTSDYSYTSETAHWLKKIFCCTESCDMIQEISGPYTNEPSRNIISGVILVEVLRS